MTNYGSHRLTCSQAMLLAFGVAALLVCFEGYSMARVLDARDWVAVSGRITKSKMERHRSHSYSSQRGTRTNSKLRIEYKYSYNGKTRRGTRVNFGGLASMLNLSGFDWSGVLKKYPQGKSVTVYVDPKRPDTSALERDFPQSAVIGLGTGVTTVILIGGIFLLPSGQRQVA
jgi:Protein of unknown function (DUF3592)